jgi:response regulator RpfG family c-di-GMP phosphodiesterase
MRDLNRADDQDCILDLVVRAVGDVCGARRISIMLVDEKGEHLVCRRALGIDTDLAARIRIAPTEGISGQVFRTGRTLSASTVGVGTTDRGYDADAFVSTPLETPSGVLGVVNATDKADGQPLLREEVECIRSIADAAAIALDNVRRRDQLSQSVRVLLKTVGHLAEYRDEETTLHLERVSRMTGILAMQLARGGPYAEHITEECIAMLVQAAPLHDIGKVGIADEILMKPGKLTDEEFMIMKSHTDIGRRVLSLPLDEAHPVPLLKLCIDIAWCHHERYDGRGYPRRLAGESIPLSARIVALVDAYDAITSRRRYKAERSHEDAVEIIRGERGAHFDPHIVDAFLECHSEFDSVRARYADSVEMAPASA